jgi:hypothetical protein
VLDTSALGVYRREASTWEKISNLLLLHESVDDRYQEDVGGLCSSSSIDESTISRTASPTENPSVAPSGSPINQGKDIENPTKAPTVRCLRIFQRTLQLKFLFQLLPSGHPKLRR